MGFFVVAKTVDYWQFECFPKKKTIEELRLEHGTVWSRDLDHSM